ncbi:MAG: 30S ribosomal protein S16 [Candidatus Hydrothermales bacterium]
MLKIRLARFGKNKEPKYRIVVMEARSKREGKMIDILGYYDPRRDTEFKVDLDKFYSWIKKGAKPTDRVKSLVKRAKRESPASS